MAAEDDIALNDDRAADYSLTDSRQDDRHTTHCRVCLYSLLEVVVDGVQQIHLQTEQQTFSH